jgi:predicted acylesterase/phospholipase RssA
VSDAFAGVRTVPGRVRGLVRRRLNPRLDEREPAAFEQSETLLEDPLLLLRRTETALVRADLAEPEFLTADQLSRLRYLLSLARLTVFAPGAVAGRPRADVDVSDVNRQFRLRVTTRLCEPMRGLRHASARLTFARKMLEPLTEVMREHRQNLLELGQFSADELDAEVAHRTLALVLGGGAGAGHVYMGALGLLAEEGLLPAYVMGTSIGSMYGAMFTRRPKPDMDELRAFAHGLSLGTVLAPPRRTRRHGMPGLFSLMLEDTLGPMLQGAAGSPLRLHDMAIPFEAVVAGVRQSAFDRLPSRFRHAEISRLSAMSHGGPGRAGVMAARMWQVGAFFDSRVAKPIVFGADHLTRGMRTIDAVGFSCAVPGVLHYETPEPSERAGLDRLLREKEVRALIDGGVTSNVAIELARRRVQDGRLGTRNAVVLAFDCFQPQWDSRHLWLTPITQSMQVQMVRNAPFADWVRRFSPTLSVLDLVPGPERFARAEAWGRASLEPDVPLLKCLLAPSPWPA